MNNKFVKSISKHRKHMFHKNAEKEAKANGQGNPLDSFSNAGEGRNKESKGIRERFKGAKQGMKQLGNNIRAAGQAIGHGVNILTAAITSPITWIIIGGVFLYLTTISGMAILGQSDFAWNCGTLQSSGQSFGSVPKAKYSLDQITKFASSPVQSTWGISDDTVENWAISRNSVALRVNGVNRSNIKGVAAAVKSKGVSPVFFFMYAVLEGGGSGGYINHADSTGHETIPAALADAAWIKQHSEQQSITPPAQHGGIKATIPTTKLVKWLKALPSNSIGRVYVGGTAATTAEMAIRLGEWKYPAGQRQYGMNLEAMIDFVKQMGGNPFSAQTMSGYADGEATSCTGDDGIGANAGDIVSFAKSLAWPWSEHTKGNVNGGNGMAQATAAYKKAFMRLKGHDGLLASCDRFVATVMKTVKDKDYPWGSTVSQLAYLKSSSKYKLIPCGQQQPGDIVIGTNTPGGGAQHTFILGPNGYAYSASIGDHVGIEDKNGRWDPSTNSNGTGCSGKYIRGANGHPYGTVFRFVGRPDPEK